MKKFKYKHVSHNTDSNQPYFFCNTVSEVHIDECNFLSNKGSIPSVTPRFRFNFGD